MSIMRTTSWPGLLTFSLLLAACASRAPAPVIERAPPVAVAGEGRSDSTPIVGHGMYLVKKGDTLRAIALDHGQNYRDLAGWNNLTDPDKINVGQLLRIIPPEAPAEPVATARPVSLSGLPASTSTSKPPAAASLSSNNDLLKRSPKGGKQPYTPEALAALQAAETPHPPPATNEPKPPEPAKPATKVPPAPVAPAAPADSAIDWMWPASGKLLGGFVEGGNKGLDIAGKTGDPVVAAAAGKVTLVSVLRGYGNLVVIKHNDTLLSVYAHNNRILVKEGQSVTKGQKIAEIGSSDADQAKLHFEIRRQGKPLDPAGFLPAR